MSRREWVQKYRLAGTLPFPGGYARYLQTMGVLPGPVYASSGSQAAQVLLSGVPGRSANSSSDRDFEGIRTVVLPFSGSDLPSHLRDARHFAVSASSINIVYNRFGAYNPKGKVFVLEEDLERVETGSRTFENKDGDRLGPFFNAGHDPIFLGSGKNEPLYLKNPATGAFIDRNGDGVTDETKRVPVLTSEPLVIRANVGDTVVIDFTNRLTVPGGEDGTDHRANLTLHGVPYDFHALNGTEESAPFPHPNASNYHLRYILTIGANPESEGTYYFHSQPVLPSDTAHGLRRTRTQIAHGLFGALIVEPKGSIYYDTEAFEISDDDGFGDYRIAEESYKTIRSGWGAIIDNKDPDIPAYREYVIFFHDDLGGKVEGLIEVDPRALNYRTEPFADILEREIADTRPRLEGKRPFAVNDHSMAYSAYTYGDSSTPHPRFYVGDPMRYRIVHGGTGDQFHVFHHHAHRWRFQNGVTETGAPKEKANLTRPSKLGLPEFAAQPDLTESISTRVDSQTLGPAETFDVFMEGGAGGVQRTVGDVLFHCHIIDHVVRGMWTYARIFNTLQTRTSFRPGLAPLPDRLSAGFRPPQAVDSITLAQLVESGQGPIPVTGAFAGRRLEEIENELYPFIDSQLPRRGDPDLEELDSRSPVSANSLINRADLWPWDALDLSEGRLYLGEPSAAGADSLPHSLVDFGLGFPTVGEGVGANRMDFVEVDGEREELEAPRLLFNPIDGRLAYPFLLPHAGRRPPFAPKHRLSPPNSTDEQWLLQEDAKVQGTAYLGPTFGRNDPGRVGPQLEPLGVPFGSGLAPEEADSEPSKVRHYDIVAVELPINYSTHNGARISGSFGTLPDQPDSPDPPGPVPGPRLVEIIGGPNTDAWQIRIDGIGQNTDEIAVLPGDTIIWKVEANIHGLVFANRTTAESILLFDQTVGESLDDLPNFGNFGAEAFGTGGFPAPTILARASVKSDPLGTPQRIVDFTCRVHGPAGMNARLVVLDTTEPDAETSFEFFAIASDTENWHLRVDGVPQEPAVNPTDSVIRPGDSISWKVEGGFHGLVFSDRATTESILDFDPAVGQPLEDDPNFGGFGTGAFGTTGFGPGTLLASAIVKVGISESESIDFLCKVHGGDGVQMRGRLALSPPPRAPEPDFIDPRGQIFVLRDDAKDIFAGRKRAEPLVIRANTGDVVDITLTSALVDTTENEFLSKVGMHTHLVQYDVQSSDGAVAGLNYETSIRPSLRWDRNEERFIPIDEAQTHDEQVHYRWWCDVELGTVYWHDHSLLKDSLPHGLFAATIVEPRDSTYHDPQTGSQLYIRNSEDIISRTSSRNGLALADIRIGVNGGGKSSFREVVPLFNDGRRNRKSINLRSEPLVRREKPLKARTTPFDVRWDRAGRPQILGGNEMRFSSILHGDPVTPIWRAFEGDPIRIRVEGSGPDEIHTLNLHGHRWRYEHNNPNSTFRDFVLAGVSEAFSFTTDPMVRAPEGDYLYSDPSEDDLIERGKWGLLRIQPETDTTDADSRANGTIRIFIDAPSNVNVSKGHLFTSASGVRFLTRETTSVDSETIENNVARRFDPPALFFEIPLVAEIRGDQGNIPANMLFATELDGIEFETEDGDEPTILEMASKERFVGGLTPLQDLQSTDITQTATSGK